MTTFTESFTTGNSTTLGPNLSWTELYGDAEIFSNKWRNVTDNNDCVTRANSDTGGADMFVQATINFTGGGVNAGICGRFSSGAVGTLTYYNFEVNSSGTSNVRLYSVDDTSSFLVSTEIGTPPSFTLNASTNYVLRMEMQGTTIRCYIDGVLQRTDTNSTVSTGQRGGLECFAPASSVTFASFSYGLINEPTPNMLLGKYTPGTVQARNRRGW